MLGYFCNFPYPTRGAGKTAHKAAWHNTSTSDPAHLPSNRSRPRQRRCLMLSIRGFLGCRDRQDSRDATANNSNTTKNIRHMQQQLRQDRTYPIRSPATMWPPPQHMPTAHPPFPTMLFYSPSPAPGNLVVIVKGTGYLRGAQGPGLKGRADSEASIEQKSVSHSVTQSSICNVWTPLGTSLFSSSAHRIASRDPLGRMQVSGGQCQVKADGWQIVVVRT